MNKTTVNIPSELFASFSEYFMPYAAKPQRDVEGKTEFTKAFRGINFNFR